MFISLQIYKSAWGFASMALVVGAMQYPARVMPLRCLKQAAKISKTKTHQSSLSISVACEHEDISSPPKSNAVSRSAAWGLTRAVSLGWTKTRMCASTSASGRDLHVTT